MPTHVQDKHDWVIGLTAEDAGWLSTLPFTLCLRDTLLVVHAGLVPGNTSDILCRRPVGVCHCVPLCLVIACHLCRVVYICRSATKRAEVAGPVYGTLLLSDIRMAQSHHGSCCALTLSCADMSCTGPSMLDCDCRCGMSSQGAGEVRCFD